MRYVHIMPHGNAEHNGSIIKLINNNIEFDSKEHLFVTFKDSVYNVYKEYENVVFSDNDTVDELNKYSDICDYIFLHSLSLNFKDYIKLKKKTAKKIIWVIWTFDLYGKKPEIHSFKDVLRTIRYLLVFGQKRHYIKMFKGIGVGFKYDALEIVSKYGKDINIYLLPYGYNEDNSTLLNCKNEEKTDDEPIKVMIGHSAYSFLNHYEIMKLLTKFKNENILLSVVTSYGDKDYADELSVQAKQLWGEKIEIIDQYMNMQDYIKYLNTVDIAIIDYPYQVALGNIHRLMSLKKKIFLTEDGALKKAYNLEGVKTFNVSDIENMSFDEFSDMSTISEWERVYGLNILDKKTKISAWKNTLEELSR